MPNFPLINGNRYDFSSVEIAIGLRRTLGVKEISYGDGLEPGMVYGAHAQPIGRTRGQYKAEASLTLFRQEFDELVAELGQGFLEREFDIHVTYADDGQPTVTDRIASCRITKPDHSASGTDALEVKLTLNPMFIIRNGVAPLANMLGSIPA